jgi:hypothetical protein
VVAGESGEAGNPGTLGMTKRRGSLKGREPLPRARAVVGVVGAPFDCSDTDKSPVEKHFLEMFFGCRFLPFPFDVPVESGIHSEGDNDHAIHDADDPQGI